MKTALIIIKSQEESFNSERISDIYKIFEENQAEISSSNVILDTDDLGFRRKLNESVDSVDSLVVIGLDSVKFNVKSLVAQEFSLPLSINENALNFVSGYCDKNGIEIKEEFATFPQTANVIPNKMGICQGFMLEQEDIIISFFPFDFKETSKMLLEYYFGYMESKVENGENYIFKHFGDVGFLKSTLEKIKTELNAKVRITLNSKYGDSLVKLDFDYGENNSIEFLRRLSLALGDTLYADFDTTLQERLFSALTLHGKKVSFAESFTAGRVASSIINIPGASKIVHEGIISYSNESKVKRLGVKVEDLKTLGAVSSKVAYEMALGLLSTNECDLAISTTGIAGPKSDDTLKPVGLCFIGIGMKDGIYVYKRELKGNREEITETAKNTALFLAIKKIKNL